MVNNQPGFLSFAKSTVFFFVGSTLSKVITLLLLPLYTRNLPTADYGYFDLSVTYVTLLTAFLYCDIWSSVMRFMRDDLTGEAPKRIVAGGWVLFALSTIVYYAIGMVASLFINIPNIGYILAYGTFFNLISMFSYISRGWEHNTDFAISGVLNTIVNVTLNVILILVFHIGYTSLYISFIAGCASQCLFLFIRLRMWKLLAKPTFSQISMLFKYSAPLGINSVAYWLLNSFGRTVVSRVMSLSANGIFAVGSKFGSTISLATTCFTYAWQDITFKSEMKPVSFYASAVRQYAAFLISATSILLPAISLAFPILIGEDYNEAYGIIPSFLLVAAASAVSTFIGNIFYVIKDTKTISRSMIIACICNVVLVYPLTIAFGALGTNLSILSAFLINIVQRLFILKKKISLSLSYRKLIGPVILLVSSYTVYMMNLMVLTGVYLVIALIIAIYMYRDKFSILYNAVFLKNK